MKTISPFDRERLCAEHQYIAQQGWLDDGPQEPYQYELDLFELAIPF